jgi:hypothetical protein
MAPSKERIAVPQRVINGGVDFKFEEDSYAIKLHGLMTTTQYTDAITRLNDMLKPSRSKKIDTILLATGVLMVPLALWGIRHGMLTKKRKRLLKQYIQEFNGQNPTLHMRWNRRPESSLTIERRQEELHGVPPPLAELIASNQQMVECPAPISGDQHTSIVYAEVSEIS